MYNPHTGAFGFNPNAKFVLIVGGSFAAKRPANYTADDVGSIDEPFRYSKRRGSALRFG